MKRVIKVLMLFCLCISLNVIFSDECKAVEIKVLTTERAVTIGKQFNIRAEIEYSNRINVSATGGNNEEYIYVEEIKEISNKNGIWTIDLVCQSKKVGTSTLKIVAEQTGGFLGAGNDTKETVINITILPDLETAYKEEPSENANAQSIKYFILSDKQYNNSNNLKNIAENNPNKIKKWKETIDELISSDRHYATENQYGAVQSILEDIVTASEKGESIEGAIENNSEAIDSAYDLVEESTNRITIANTDLGSDRTPSNFVDVLDDTENYMPTDSDEGVQSLTDKASIILTIITNIGMIIAVLMCAILGVKYMLSSIEEKAEYKKDMIPYLVGAFLLFGICTIVKVMQQFGESINNI